MPGIMTIKSDLDPVGTMVKGTIAELREQNKAHNEKNREKITDFYFGRQEKYINKNPYEDRQGNLLIPLITVNITKKIIDKTSLVYKNPPDRSLGVKEKDPYKEFIANHPQFNVGIKVAERLKNALHYILYRPMWYAGEWKFNWIETEFVPVFQEGDPLNAIAYFIPMKRDVTVTDTNKIEDENIWMYWSKDYYYWVSDSDQIKYDPEYPEGLNPFGRLPFVEMRKSLAVDDPWPEGAIDLVNANDAINMLLNDLNMSIRFQAFDQPYVQGMQQEDADKLRAGPNIVWRSDQPETNFGLLGFNPKIIEVVEGIQSEINIIGFAYNVHIDWALTANPASGFSLLIQNIDLLEAREDDVDMCKMYERELYEVIQVQTEKLKGVDVKALPKLTDKLNLIVDFQEIDFPINEAEKRDADDWDISHNIKTPIDLIQERNPDMDEKEAEEKFIRNKEINANYSLRQKTLSDKLKEEEIEVEE